MAIMVAGFDVRNRESSNAALPEFVSGGLESAMLALAVQAPDRLVMKTL